MPLDLEVLKLHLEDWANMSEEDYKRKIAKVVIASRTTMDPTFKTYWKNTFTPERNYSISTISKLFASSEREAYKVVKK